MIKGVMFSPKGECLVFLGITAGNVEKLKQDKPIIVRGKEIGIDIDVCIAYEETEALLQAKIEKYIGKDTVVRDNRSEAQIQDDLMKTEAARLKLGETGTYPEGKKINEEDEGGLAVAIGNDEKGNVFVNFGKQVAWVALPPDAAIDFGNSLINAGKTALAAIPKS